MIEYCTNEIVITTILSPDKLFFKRKDGEYYFEMDNDICLFDTPANSINWGCDGFMDTVLTIKGPIVEDLPPEPDPIIVHGKKVWNGPKKIPKTHYVYTIRAISRFTPAINYFKEWRKIVMRADPNLKLVYTFTGELESGQLLDDKLVITKQSSVN